MKLEQSKSFTEKKYKAKVIDIKYSELKFIFLSVKIANNKK